MASESVQELIVRIKQEGLGNLEFLRKELKQVSSQSKISEGSINKLQKEIKEFGVATKNTTDGLKGQISAFQKLRAQTGFQSQAYNSLSKEIAGLNRQLEKRLGYEREIDRMSGGRASRTTPPPGDKAVLASKLDESWTTGGTGQFAERLASMQAMLIGRTFENLRKDQQEFLKSFTPSLTTGTYDVSRLKGSENTAFKKLIDESNAAYWATSSRGPGGKILMRGDQLITPEQLTQQGTLNDIQRAALNITKDLSITSQDYLDILTKINAETRVQANQLSSADAFSEAQAALYRSDIRTSTDLKAQQDARIKSFLYQEERGAFDSKATTAKLRKAGMGPAEKQWKEGQFQWVQDIQAMLGMVSEDWQAPGYKAMLREMDQYPRAGKKRDLVRLDRTDIRAYEKRYGEFQLPKKYGKEDLILDGSKGHIDVLRAMGEGGVGQRAVIKDPLGLGADPKYPKTRFGLGEELKNLQKDLPHLKDATKPWLDLVERIAAKKKEINELIEEGTKALKARQKAIAKEVNPKFDQKLLPAAGQTSGKYTVKQLQERLATSYTPAQFTAEQYGPQLETQDQLIKRLQETIKVRTNSIKTLTEHRNKLEDIRKTLDPTSAKFKSVAKSIKQADTQLAKLNKTSKGFGKKGILGFGQSVLGGAYFGGPFGAVGAGIGQMFGGQSGAATGGLVGAQVGRPVTEFIGGSTDYAAGYAKAQITLKQVTKDANSYGVAMQAVDKAVNDFNVPQEIAIRGMTRLSAAVIGAGGNVHNAAEAFLNTTAAIKGTAGSADDVKSAITAMVQIYSKGKVSAEELSGQLGERFPAAVTRFAKANNISTQQLQKNLKDGTVGLDMLSKFVESLGTEYVPLAEKIAASNEEAGARSRIAMNKLRISIGDTLIPIGKEFQEIAADLLIDLIPALETVASIGAAAFKTLAAALKPIAGQLDRIMDAVVLLAGGSGVYALSNAFTVLANVTKMQVLRQIVKLRRAMKLLRYEMMLNPWFAAGVGAAAVGLKVHKDKVALEEFLQEVKDGEISLKDARNELKLMDEVLEGGFGSKYDAQITFWEKYFGPIGSEGRLQEIRDELGKVVTDLESLENGTKHTFEGLKKIGEDTFSGLQGGWAKFADSVKNMGEEVANVTASWFDRMASSLADFVMTGKLKFKEFARSVIADIAKMIAKQMIFNIIAGFGNMFGGGGGGGPAPFKPAAGTFGTNIPSGVQAPGMFNITPNALGNAYGKNGIVPFYKGGIVNSPTLFPFSKGVGLMGEAGPEAIVPLKRGKDGKLGIAGGGGGNITNNIVVNVKTEPGSGSGKTDVKAASSQLNMFGKAISVAVQQELVKQSRPGGLLTRG